MIESDPSVKEIFGVPDNNYETTIKFKNHGKVLYNMMDTAVDLLGPELETLKEDLIEQGEKHARFGVDPASLNVMVNSVEAVLEEVLGDQFTEHDRKAWREVDELFCLFMRIGMNHIPKRCCPEEDTTDITLNAYGAH